MLEFGIQHGFGKKKHMKDKFHGFITSVLTGMVSIYGTSIISVYTNIDTSYD